MRYPWWATRPAPESGGSRARPGVTPPRPTRGGTPAAHPDRTRAGGHVTPTGDPATAASLEAAHRVDHHLAGPPDVRGSDHDQPAAARQRLRPADGLARPDRRVGAAEFLHGPDRLVHPRLAGRHDVRGPG